MRGNFRWHTVTSVQEDDRLGQLVALSGVDSLDDSELLVGRYLLASVDELPDDLDLHDPDRLVGREVVDAATGATGAIAEVMRCPANDVWVVRGPLGEVLLPVVRASSGPTSTPRSWAARGARASSSSMRTTCATGRTTAIGPSTTRRSAGARACS